MYKIAIIGAGPTGVYTASNLLNSGIEASITLFESQAEAGKGTPYHQHWNDEHLLANIASIELPPVNDEPLIDWLLKEPDERLIAMGVDRNDIDERRFFPRVVLGEYFKAQLKRTQHMGATLSIPFAIRENHHVRDVQLCSQGITLTVEKHGQAYEENFTHVVMATGHAWPQKTQEKPGYFISPWPTSSLSSIGNCHVGIRGTSLSALDALFALAYARGSFFRDEKGVLQYMAEPGTEEFKVTLMSRKGILPEADFYCEIPYLPLRICTPEHIDKLIRDADRQYLLDKAFNLFKQELAAADPAYASRTGLESLNMEEFCKVYFAEREAHDPFEWAQKNLAEEKDNLQHRHTTQWRYAILRMHEVIARIVPYLEAKDYQRFQRHFKHIFVDDYATVPHESIERLLALHRAKKVAVLRLGEDYEISTDTPAGGAVLTYNSRQIHFQAFIEATGQRPLSVQDFPFPSLWKQGVISRAKIPERLYSQQGLSLRQMKEIDAIALDSHFHPLSEKINSSRLYCLSLPFLLGFFPFAQGITSSYDMARTVTNAIVQDIGVAVRDDTAYPSAVEEGQLVQA